jgi:hypothetical protein
MAGRAYHPLTRNLTLLALLTFIVISPFHPTAKATDAAPPRYVIVAPSAFTAALQPLRMLKAAQGFQTTLLTIEACGGNAAGIKACLRTIYEADTSTPLYVLLVGATDRLPAWPSRLNPNFQTDLYYATMDGSLDYTPNMILGRLPVRSTEELTRVITAWQAYAGLTGDEPWLRRAAFLATNHLDERLAVEAALNDLIATYTAPRGYLGGFPAPDQAGGDRLYAYTYAADRAAVRTALNEGRSLVVYLGEVALTDLPGTGTLSAWKAPAFDQNDVRALNANPIPLVLSLASRSADFTLDEPLGETWVRNTEHGALVFIGAAQDTQWALDRALARTFFAALFAEPTPSLGQVLQNALTAFAADYPDDARRYWETYTLLGDPALRPRLFSLRGDFSLSLQPTPLSLCAGSATTAQVALQSLQGFSAPVRLTLNTPPAGVQGAFLPTRLTPPGSSTLTLSADTAVPGDSYLLTLQATAETQTHTLLVPLQVAAALPAPPALSTPAVGAEGVPLQPTFTWQGDPATVTYTLEIARDGAFAAPVLVANALTQTYFVPFDPLPPNTLLYWRVRAHNPCGERVSSAGFFTTRPLPGACPDGAAMRTTYATNVAAAEPAWQLDHWAITSASVHSAPYAFHASNFPALSTYSLVSPPITLPTAAETLPHTLAFWLRTDLEDNGATCYDGLVLQVSNHDGEPWDDVPLTAYLEGAPTGTLVSSRGNSLGGHSGWCGALDWQPVRVDLTDYAGQTLRLRWAVGSDDRNESPGAWVDDVQITSCQSPPRYALTLLPTPSEQVAHGGETVIHALTLTNSGSAAATVDLSLTPDAWTATLQTPSSLLLAAGEQADIRVAVTLPADGTAIEDLAALTATVREYTGVSATAILHSRRHSYAFALTSPNLNLETPPGISFPIPLTLRNTGTLPLTLELHAASAHGWTTTPPAPLTLDAGEARSLALFVNVPAGAAAGSADILTLEAQAQGADLPAQRLEITLTVLPEPQPELAVLMVPPYLPRGGRATMGVGVINHGNLRDTLVVEVHTANPLNAVPDPGCAAIALDPGAGTNCPLFLSAPLSTDKGSYTLEVCAASSYDPQVRHCRHAAVQVTDWLTFLPLMGR